MSTARHPFVGPVAVAERRHVEVETGLVADNVEYGVVPANLGQASVRRHLGQLVALVKIADDGADQGRWRAFTFRRVVTCIGAFRTWRLNRP